MTKIGLEAIAFDIPEHFIDMVELAQARDIDPAKYTVGIGQREMAIATPCEDPVVLAAGAGLRLLKNFNIDPSSISLLIVGSETGVDHSKPISSYIHQILGLSNACRVFEIKHACYGAMAGLSMANNYLLSGKANGRKALIIATDIARYGKNTVGEPTQGAGAVAMLISDQPHLLEFDTKNEGYFAKHVMDFWRPLYSKEAFVDGHYSIQCYFEALEAAYTLYKKNVFKSGLVESLDHFNERFVACLYHVPFVKMAQKAHQKLLEVDAGFPFEKDSFQAIDAKRDFEKRTAPSLELNSRVGNIYTGALFLSLVNYLENVSSAAEGKPISLFSYGSGCGAEFMSAIVLEKAGSWMKGNSCRKIIEDRKQITIDRYEEILDACGKMDLNEEKVCQPEKWNLQRSVLYIGAKEHKRTYSVDGKLIS